MKRLQIKTAQNVNINFTLANVGQRLSAFIIDNIIKFAYLYFVIEFLPFKVFETALEGDSWSIKALDVLVFLPITFYSLYSEILLGGQTLGKKLVQIKIINIEGFKPSSSDFVIRWFLRMIDFNLFTLLFVYVSSLGLDSEVVLLILLFIFGKMIGFFMILYTDNNQRFGDVIANTIVISLSDPVKFSETILEDLTNTYIPTYPNVIKLSDNDVRIIKNTFNSAKKYNDFKTLVKLRSKVIEVTGIKSIHKTDKEFLLVILKDYNFYTQNM